MLLLSKLKAMFLRLFGSRDAIGLERPQPTTVEQGARDLVERARAGDQVAMGIICQARDRAKQRDPAAMKGVKALHAYIKANPPRSSQFGEEYLADQLASKLEELLEDDESYLQAVRQVAPELGAKSLDKAITTLANGPAIAAKLTELRDSFEGEDEKKAFAIGAVKCNLNVPDDMPQECRNALLLGYLLGMAHRIQRVREPGVPIKLLSPSAGWELGE